MPYIHKNHARREFLKRTAAFGAMGVAGPSALNMAAMSRAVASTDYKALVCVFLFGANDNYNTYVPFDTDNFNIYANARPELATPKNTLADTVLVPNLSLPDGKQFALAPQLSDLHQLWAEQHTAILLNVGPLVQPTTKQQFDQGTVPLPPRIFSHNDQQSVWQSLEPEGSTTGWGGRMADVFLSRGSVNDMFSAISVTGDSVFLSGEATVPYQVTPEGSIVLTTNTRAAYNSDAVSNAVREIMTGQLAQTDDLNLIQEAHVDVTQRSFVADEILGSALSGVNVNSPFSAGPLSSQLSIVAKIIAARSSFGLNRQVFFVGLGGFDVHRNQLEDHPPLLEEVNRALYEFYRATEELQIANEVTTFTASDFGRTLSTNGDGTDHGWGSHHMILGGAVNGGDFYGQAPELGNNGINDVGRGRLLPSTSVTQMAATLGAWFGCSPSQIVDILPSINEFSQTDLGFMSA